MNRISFVFFGTSTFSVSILNELKTAGFLPHLIVTTPDKPQGRKLILTPPPVKIWAQENNVPVIQPDTLRSEDVIKKLSDIVSDVFIVASYGKIIPKDVLEIPTRGALNVHPSLLPKLRGASPIQSSILTDERHTGVSIMLLDEQMDHGPLLAQEEILVSPWPPPAPALEEQLAQAGGKLLAHILPAWIDNKITAQEQDHTQATYTKKIEKSEDLKRIKKKDDHSCAAEHLK